MIDVYRVGWLDALYYASRVARTRPRGIRVALGQIRAQARCNLRQARRREWRDLRNTFNGYLAEPTPFPERMTRCGSGWTKKRAMRSLERHGYPGA